MISTKYNDDVSMFDGEGKTITNNALDEIVIFVVSFVLLCNIKGKINLEVLELL